MDKPIIPLDEDLLEDCRLCGSDSNCTLRCETFFELMDNLVNIQSQHQKLQALEELNQYSDDQELQAIGIILSHLSDQACAAVSRIYWSYIYQYMEWQAILYVFSDMVEIASLSIAYV